VGSDALAVIAPLLLTGLVGHGNSTATKRQSARIIENMAKLVEDPREVAPLVEQLIPALTKAMEQVANPEAREVCTKAFDQLERCKKQAQSAKMVSRDTLLAAVTAAAPKADAAVAGVVANMALALAEAKEENKEQWLSALSATPAALGLASDDTALVTELHAATMREMQPAQMGDVEEDDGNLLCDCDFSLAYGSKILLNNAKLRLKRGARYGLCGQNDCGKTTLMRAISRNQVEGFPDPAQVRTVFVETDIQGELSDMSVLDYIFADPLLRDCGVTREEMANTLSESLSS
jgi:elongation factor 3